MKRREFLTVVGGLLASTALGQERNTCTFVFPVPAELQSPSVQNGFLADHLYRELREFCAAPSPMTYTGRRFTERHPAPNVPGKPEITLLQTGLTTYAIEASCMEKEPHAAFAAASAAADTLEHALRTCAYSTRPMTEYADPFTYSFPLQHKKDPRQHLRHLRQYRWTKKHRHEYEGIETDDGYYVATIEETERWGKAIELDAKAVGTVLTFSYEGQIRDGFREESFADAASSLPMLRGDGLV